MANDPAGADPAWEQVSITPDSSWRDNRTSGERPGFRGWLMAADLRYTVT